MAKACSRKGSMLTFSISVRHASTSTTLLSDEEDEEDDEDEDEVEDFSIDDIDDWSFLSEYKGDKSHRI